MSFGTLTKKLFHFFFVSVLMQALPIAAYTLIWFLSAQEIGNEIAIDWTASFVLASFTWIIIPSYLSAYPWSRQKRNHFALISSIVGYSLLTLTLFISVFIQLLSSSPDKISLDDVITNRDAQLFFENTLVAESYLLMLLITIGSAGAYLAYAHSKSLRKVRLRLMWKHQAQFVGFYCAKKRGYFESAGIAVQIEETDPKQVQIRGEMLASGADFATLSAIDVLLGREEGFGILSISMLVKANVIVFFVHNDSGIISPNDFKGKTIGVRIGYDEYKALLALLAKFEIDEKEVNIVDVGDDIAPFLDRDIDIWSGHTAAEPIEATCRGARIRCFHPDEYGITFGGDVLITSDAMCSTEPDLVRAFRRCVKDGWDFAYLNFDDAFNDVKEFTGRLDTSQQRLQKGMLRQMIALVYMDGRFPARQKESDWKPIAKIYQEQNIGKANFDLGDLIF